MAKTADLVVAQLIPTRSSASVICLVPDTKSNISIDNDREMRLLELYDFSAL
jgi:hypothetical protein